MAKEKEVATGARDMKTREESFGSAPPKIKLSRGEMCTFGHKEGSGVWPKRAESVDQKSGYPDGRSMGGGSKQ
jgi:hypothetical protein